MMGMADHPKWLPSTTYRSSPSGGANLFDIWKARIPVVVDPSMPRHCFEMWSGDQRLRVRWPDPETEIARWADDGGPEPDGR